ncbi:MAG: site-specific integrase [Selenomonadaceae bacterium]
MNIKEECFMPNDKDYIKDNKLIKENAGLSAKSKRRLSNAKSENTIKAYDADWRDFVDWCTYHDMESLPTTPETIVNYISDLADNAKANTIARRVTAISENHIAAGYDREQNPAKSGLVRATIASIRREKGTFQRGKAPILMDTLSLLADVLDGDDLVSIRDRALILLGFAGAFRRSELVAVRVEDLTFMQQGLVVFIPRAKGDQLGKGSTIAIPYAPDPKICAVRAVKKWLDASRIESGPLFRPFKKNDELRDRGLSDKSVALIVKKYVELAGLDPREFAGHSLRRGFATSAAQHDVDTLSIMRQTRHKSEKMVHRYIEQGKLFKDNPLNKMFKND